MRMSIYNAALLGVPKVKHCAPTDSVCISYMTSASPNSESVSLFMSLSELQILFVAIAEQLREQGVDAVGLATAEIVETPMGHAVQR